MKISPALILALALPLTMSAQQAPAGPTANPITAAFRVRTMAYQRNLALAFDSIPEAKFGYKPTWPKATLVEKLKASFTFCENAFAQLDDTKLPDQVTLTFNGNSRNVSRVTMVLGHVIDMTDHYSQLSNYMRLNNMLPPTALPRPNRGGQ